jgi:hypothetical protein
VSAGWTDFADAQASGGHFEYAAAGATCSIVPLSTTTAVLLGGFANSSVATAQITVDGVVEGTWTLVNNTSDPSASWNLYRTLYHPISLTPGTTHTILITVLTGNFSLDFVDVYIADATPANPTMLLANGHSIMAGGQGDAGPAQVTSTTRFAARVAAALGLTEYNIASPGESLSFFSNPNSTPTVPNNAVGTNNSYGGIVEGWKRIDTGQYLGTGGATISPWELASPAVALAMWGLNDIDFGPYGGGGTTPATTPPGPASTLGGYTYYQARFMQRLRELIWRMMVQCPSTICVICGIAPTIDVTAPDSVKLAWTNIIASVCFEASMNHYPIYVDVWSGMANASFGPPRLTSTTGGARYAVASGVVDQIHPNAFSHALIAQPIIAAIRERMTPRSGIGVW